MSLRFRLRPLLVLLVSAAAGCGAAVQVLCAPKERPHESVNVSDKDDGGKIDLPRGGTLVVTLDSNPTTGYEWQIAKCNRRRLLPVGKPEFIPPKTRLIGAGGQRVFRFQARALGSTLLELHYLRPFQKDQPPAKIFRLTVAIEPTRK